MNPNWLGGLKTISLFGIALAIVFVLLFIKEDRLKELFKFVEPDHISVLYLNLLLNIDPNNASLRLELANQYTNLGKYDLARIEIEPLLAIKGPEEIGARLLMLEIDFKNYFLITKDDTSREIELVKLRNRIIEISKNQVSVALIPKVIKLSLELGQPAVAAGLYYQWSTTIIDPTKRFEKLQESGRWYTASGMPQRAAEVYNECYELAKDATQARQFAFLTLKSLQTAGKRKLALKYIRNYQQRFPKDPEFLDEEINIYLADNDQKSAYKLGALRLSLDPSNPEQIRKQVERALAVGEIQSALISAQRMVEIVPTNYKAHEDLGQIAEWAAMPELALNEWLWLARNRKDDKAIANTIRLSKGLFFTKIAIEMLVQLSNIRELTRDEMSSLLFAYNEAGNLSNHVNFLKSYLERYPENLQAWKALAKTQENAGQLTHAITTWQYIGSHFVRQVEAVTHQAELMWKNGQTEEAFSLLLLNLDNATAIETQFWIILSELSWELERPENALLAYRTLWKAGTANELVAERLIQLTRDMGEAEESIAIGEEAYSRFNQPRWLLLSMDVANQAGLPDQLKRVLRMAISNEPQFQNLEMYWLMRAQLDTHENKPKIAIKHYQQALKVNPISATAKEGMLWNFIGQNDRRSLRSYIKIWRQDASENSSLWGVYGLALAKVGQNKEALPWFERKARISPDDYLWLLTYADVLSKAGHIDAAWRVRKYVLFNLRLRFKQTENVPDKDIKSLLHPQYLALIRDLEGANADVSILKMFLAKGYDDPTVRELLIAAYLSQENYSAARFWLLENHVARQKIPAWQRLALALAENDLTVAAHILEKENDQLSTSNKVETLKRLNRNEEALALTYELLELHNDQSSFQAALFNSRDELTVKSSKQVAVALNYKSLGELNIIESRARFNTPYLHGALALELKQTQLDFSGSDIVLPVKNEVDITGGFKHPLRDGVFQVNLGGNLREDKSLVYGAVKVSQNVTNKLKAHLHLGMNEISEVTGGLRSLGAKDTVLFGLSSNLTKQIFLHFDIDGHRYLTRQGSTLGKGYKLQTILGSSLLTTDMQDWQIRLQGSWESNSLEQTLPSELIGLVGPSVAGVETLIAPKFGTLGLGTTFRYGASDQGVLRRPFVLADVWAGRVWPANALGYNGRIAMGISLFGSDTLSAEAFYSNVQGGLTNQPFKGAGIQYSIRF